MLASISALRDEFGPALYVGCHEGRGVMLYVSAEDGRLFSRGDGAPDGEPLSYMYMRSEDEYPSNAEVPIALVRQAAHEFVGTGGRPTCVRWQTWERPHADTESEYPGL